MKRYAVALLAGLLVSLPAAAQAQPQVHVSDGQTFIVEQSGKDLDASDARRVRAQLGELLRQHPPSLRTVFQADPTLLQSADYLAPYPRIAEFLKQHPEVARDPQFFVGSIGNYWDRNRTPQEQAYEMLEGVLTGLAVFTGMMTVLFVLATLVRQAINHRRWSRQSRVQTEVHTKILDRLQSNDELLAYIQTPAGQRFLQSGPSPMADPVEPRALSAPLGRIFWSVQVGVVLLALGIGFWFVQRNVMAEIAPVFSSMGVIAAALGIGAICSGVVSYLLSVRFGLLKPGE
jgi:hypothetical protein